MSFRGLWQKNAKQKPRKNWKASELWGAATEYFEWCEKNPRYRYELVKYRGDATEAEVPLKRMYSMQGFTVFLGVTGSYFRTVKNEIRERLEAGKADDNEKEVLETIERIESVIQADQIEGAASGQYVPVIVTRLNSLADNVNVHGGAPQIKISVRDEETQKHLSELDDLL